jgi:hypothetical protein
VVEFGPDDCQGIGDTITLLMELLNTKLIFTRSVKQFDRLNGFAIKKLKYLKLFFVTTDNFRLL